MGLFAPWKSLPPVFSSPYSSASPSKVGRLLSVVAGIVALHPTQAVRHAVLYKLAQLASFFLYWNGCASTATPPERHIVSTAISIGMIVRGR